MQLTLPDVVERVKQWDEELAAKMDETEVKSNSGVVVEDLGDGWTIRQVVDAKEAKEEGDAMGHCVGSYGRSIEIGETLIYSLRDPKNQPHATIEITPREHLEDVANDNLYLSEALSFVNKHITQDLHDPKQYADADNNEKVRNELLRKMQMILAGGLQESPELALMRPRIKGIFDNVVKLIKMKADGKDIDQIVKDYLAKQLTKIDPSGGAIVQIQGKENKKPIDKYQKPIGQWLLSMDEAPYYERTAENIYVPAPTTAYELAQWDDPYIDDRWHQFTDYDHEVVHPRRIADYFPEGQEHGYLQGDADDETFMEIHRESIRPENWQAVIKDLLVNYPTEVGKVKEIAERYELTDEFNKATTEYIANEVYPMFEIGYYDPNSPEPIEEQWRKFPLSGAVDNLLGQNYFTQEPYFPQRKQINPEQNKLFGPGENAKKQEAIKAYQDALNKETKPGDEPKQVPGDFLELMERNVGDDPLTPWQDPRNYDYQEGRFARLMRKLRGRRANILDEIHDQLDPTVWDNAYMPRPTLKPYIAEWITTYVVEALARNGYTHMEEWLTLVVTGSLTTYQYSPNSDCDISLFVNAEAFPDWSRAEMIAIMMDECDDTLVPGTSHPLQCYVVPSDITREDLYKPGLRSAYDIATNNWIVAPEKDRVHDVKREMNEATTIALENADKMEKLIRYEPIKAIKFYNQVHKRRQKDMALGKGDFSPSNITYKMIEQRGLFDQVKSLMKQLRDNE
jgi:hypothetical protein